MFVKTYVFDDSVNECESDFYEYMKTFIAYDILTIMCFRGLDFLFPLSEWSLQKIWTWCRDEYGYNPEQPVVYLTYNDWAEGVDEDYDPSYNYNNPVMFSDADQNPAFILGASKWAGVEELDLDDTRIVRGTNYDLVISGHNEG